MVLVAMEKVEEAATEMAVLAAELPATAEAAGLALVMGVAAAEAMVVKEEVELVAEAAEAVC